MPSTTGCRQAASAVYGRRRRTCRRSCDDSAIRLKLAAELRLLETSLVRSRSRPSCRRHRKSQKAIQAARTRWDRMPRVRGGGGGPVGGIRVAGIYRALLERERARSDDPHYWDPRWMRLHHSGGEYCTSPGVVCEHEPPPPQYRRSSVLLAALEAGMPVVVARSFLGGDHISGKHWPGPPPDLPWGRHVVRMRITSHDRVTSAA